MRKGCATLATTGWREGVLLMGPPDINGRQQVSRSYLSRFMSAFVSGMIVLG